MTPIPPHPNTVCDPTLIWLWGWGWPARGHCAQVTEQNTGTLRGLPASLFPPWRQRRLGSPTMTFQPTPGSRLGFLRPPSVPSRVPQPLGLASPLPKTSLLINQPPPGEGLANPQKETQDPAPSPYKSPRPEQWGTLLPPTRSPGPICLSTDPSMSCSPQGQKQAGSRTFSARSL